MLLVVFVTLVISVIGLFAQVLSLQNTRIYNAQNGLMQVMSSWHNTAVNMVHAMVPTNISTSGCLMTTANTAAYPALLPVCLHGGNYTVNAANLPTGYNASPYTFYSIAYQTTAPAANYIITFVIDADSSGYLMLPDRNGTAVGYTIKNLAAQFNRTTQTNLGYGWVTASGTLVAQMPGTGRGGTGITYPIPSSIPTGALAVISPAQ